jgi:hypothetical protein
MLDAIANNTFAILLTFTLFSSCEELCNGPEIGGAVPQSAQFLHTGAERLPILCMQWEHWIGEPMFIAVNTDRAFECESPSEQRCGWKRVNLCGNVLGPMSIKANYEKGVFKPLEESF